MFDDRNINMPSAHRKLTAILTDPDKYHFLDWEATITMYYNIGLIDILQSAA